MYHDLAIELTNRLNLKPTNFACPFSPSLMLFRKWYWNYYCRIIESYERPATRTSSPAMATCPFVSITARLDNRPYLHVYLLLVSLYMEGGEYYHISVYGFGRTVRASISIQANIAICGRGTGRLPSQCFRTVLNSVPTVSTPFASSRLLVTVIPQW